MRAEPPYDRAEPLDLLPDQQCNSIEWTADGRFAFLHRGDGCWEYRPAKASLTRLPYTVLAASGDGGVVAVPTTKGLKVRWRNTGQEVEIYSSDRPAKVFNALRRTGDASFYELFLYPDTEREEPWADAVSSLTPDGKSLYFASTVGVPEVGNAQGPYAVFGADTRTGALEALAWLDGLGGMMCDTWAVSPDGRRILAVFSSRVGPFAADVAVCGNLRRHREVDLVPAQGKLRYTVTHGSCWSPDGRFVVLSAAHYDPVDPRFCPPGTGRLILPPETLEVHSAASGRLLLRLGGGTLPSWSR
jgi:hypothetical protein